MNVGKIFLLIGVIFIIIGIIWNYIGKLPGDIVVKKGNVTVFFPIMTCIVVSIILTVIFYIINKFR